MKNQINHWIGELNGPYASGREAASQLVNIGVDAVPILIETLQDQSSFARAQAAWAIGELAPTAKTAIVPLAERLTDPKRSVREESAWALMKFGREAESVLPNLVDVLGDDDPENGNVREAAALSMAAIGDPALPSLLELLHSDAKDTCGYAAIALKELGSAAAEAVPGLLRHLSHESRFVRHGCVKALGAIGSAAFEAIEPLIAMMGAAGHDVGQRKYCANALIEIGESSVRPVLLSDLGKADEALEMPPQIRFDDEVLRIIREIGAVAIPDLVWGVKMGTPTSSRAYALLVEWNDEATAHLEEAISDNDLVIRSKAKELLQQRQAERFVVATSMLQTHFSATHDRLMAMLRSDKDVQKTKERLASFQAFVVHGSFRKVAALEAQALGLGDESPDHSGPASRIKRLGELLETPLTRLSDGPGLRRAELTDAGHALADWIKANPSWIA